MASASFKLVSFPLVFLLMLTCPFIWASLLEILSEEEVKQLISDGNDVVVLLSIKVECTGRCEDLEDTLALIREDVVEALNAWVVRTHSPALAEEYGLNDKKVGSGVVFIRKGIPLLYTGHASDDDFMLHYLITNRESKVHSLSDVNFEHLTQAATGATTGDWLVMFSRSGCDTCTQLRATIEAVAVNLRNQKNVAIIDRDNDGGQTTRRFGVKTFPSFILFRQGRMYRYNLPVIDDKTLKSFALEGFRNVRAEDIPHPKAPFDDYTECIADWLRENPNVVYTGTAVCVVGILTIGVLLMWSSKASTKKLTKKRQ